MGISYVQYGGLQISLATDKDYYSPGEPVRMSLLSQNISDRPMVLTYPSGQRYDFSVVGTAGEIWRWSEGRVFILVEERVVLLPGDTLAYSEIWHQQNRHGFGVAPGIYGVSGWNTFRYSEMYPRPLTFIMIGVT